MEFSFSYLPPYILFCFYLMDARTGSACQSGAREDRARQLSSVTRSCFAHALGLLAIRHVPSRYYNPLFSFGLCIHRITASSHCGHSCSLRFELKAGNCWFARDVTAAMLVVNNKSISLLWELNSIFM